MSNSLSQATNLSQSVPGSDDNEEVLHIPRDPGLESQFSVISKTHVSEVLPRNRDAIGVFYNPSRLGQAKRRWEHAGVKTRSEWNNNSLCKQKKEKKEISSWVTGEECKQMTV